MQSTGDMVPCLKGLNIQIETELYCYLIFMKACRKQQMLDYYFNLTNVFILFC